MSLLSDPLKETAQELHHRFWFSIRTEKEWYTLMQECRIWFGKNWRSQSKVRRKLSSRYNFDLVPVWFEVPDPRFATWMSVKYWSIVRSDNASQTPGK